MEPAALPAPTPPRTAPGHEPARAEAVGAVLLAAALFGTTGTSQALGPADATPLGVGAVRLAVGAAALVLLASWRRPPAAPALRPHLPALLAGGLAVAAYQLAWFAGLRRTGVALGTVVGIGSGPVFAGLLHLAATRRPPPRSWAAGTALTLAGAALLALRGGGGAPADLLGLACMLLAGASYAAYSQASKHALERGLDPGAAMAGVFAAGALVSAPLLLLEPLGWVATPRGVALALHLGVLTIALAYRLFAFGLRNLSVPTVVTLTLGEPLVAVALGVLVLGERLGAAGWAGAALVVAGLVVASRVEARGR